MAVARPTGGTILPPLSDEEAASLSCIRYAQEDSGMDIPMGTVVSRNTSRYFKLRPDVCIPVAPDGDTEQAGAVAASYARRLIDAGLCVPCDVCSAAAAGPDTTDAAADPIIQPIVDEVALPEPALPEPASEPTPEPQSPQTFDNGDTY